MLCVHLLPHPLRRLSALVTRCRLRLHHPAGRWEQSLRPYGGNRLLALPLDGALPPTLAADSSYLHSRSRDDTFLCVLSCRVESCCELVSHLRFHTARRGHSSAKLRKRSHLSPHSVITHLARLPGYDRRAPFDRRDRSSPATSTC